MSLSLFKIFSPFFLPSRPADKCSSPTWDWLQLFALHVPRETPWATSFWFCSQYWGVSATWLEKRSFIQVSQVRDYYYLHIIFRDITWHLTVPFLDHMAWLKLLSLRKKYRRVCHVQNQRFPNYALNLAYFWAYYKARNKYEKKMKRFCYLL